MTALISIFDIPLLLDTICIRFTTRESLLPCLLVCRHWYDCFLPQVHRFIELDYHKDDIRIEDILYQAQSRRLRSLDVDIVDVGYFLHSEGCVSLETLRCGDYQAVSLAKRLTKRLAKEVDTECEKLGLALGMATVEAEADFRRRPIPEDAFENGMIRDIASATSTATKADLSEVSEDDGDAYSSDEDNDDDDGHNSDDDGIDDKDATTLPPPFSRINVSTLFKMTTALIARNPHLRILEFTNDRLEQNYDVVPNVTPLIPRLVHLTKLKILVIMGLHEEFLASLLCYIPESMQDVEIKARELLPPKRSIQRSMYPTITRKPSLRRLCLNPCGFKGFVGDNNRQVESNVMIFILKTVERSPHLVELELMGRHNEWMDVLQTLSWYCPEVERLSLRVAFYHLWMIGHLNVPPLLNLREVHLEGDTDDISNSLSVDEQYRRVLPDFLLGSYKTLEVLTVEVTGSAEVFETEAWNFWRECPRLKRYTFRVSQGWGTAAPRHHQLVYLVDNIGSSNSYSHRKEKDNNLSSTWACLELEELDITIQHAPWQECRERRDQYHLSQFLPLVRLLYQQLRLLKRLKQLRLRWDYCGKYEYLAADKALDLVNATDRMSEADMGLMTIEDTAWMGLPWREK